MADRPLIGCATYRKTVDQTPPIDVYGLMPSYTKAVLEAGGLPVLIPLGLDADSLRAVVDRLDGVLLPGGGDIEPSTYGGDQDSPLIRGLDVERDRVELLLIRHALQEEKPLLAICRGHQVLNVALGGTLWEDIPDQMPGAMDHDLGGKQSRDYLAHEVEIDAGSRLGDALQTPALVVNSFHHQGIRRLAPDLRAVAHAPDGLVEGVEVAGHPFAVGVQWHPENILRTEPRMLGLFRAFVDAAGHATRVDNGARDSAEATDGAGANAPVETVTP